MDSHGAELTALQRNAGGMLQSKVVFLAQTLPANTWVSSFPTNSEQD